MGDSLEVLPEYFPAPWRLADNTVSDKEADTGVLFHSGRVLRQAPQLASSDSISRSLAEACPDVDTESASFLCSAAETTLSSEQSV